MTSNENNITCFKSFISREDREKIHCHKVKLKRKKKDFKNQQQIGYTENLMIEKENFMNATLHLYFM